MSIAELRKLSSVEKMKIIEMLWADVAADEAAFESPAWHGEALREAQRAYEAGEAKFIDWNVAKEELRRKAHGAS